MAPMKAMKARSKAMTKTEMAAALATEYDLKKSVCSQVIGSLAAIATKEVKSDGKFIIILGVSHIKTRQNVEPGVVSNGTLTTAILTGAPDF